MSEQGRDRRDPRWRPPDPAGTRPKHDPQSLLPQRTEPLLAAEPEVVDATVADGDDEPSSALPARRAPAGGVAAADAPKTSRWTPRFQFLFGILLTIGVAAIAAVVVLAVRQEDPEPVLPPWSAWAPSARDEVGAQQIAQHVSSAYKLGNGRQLVHVTAGPLEVEGVPLDIAVRHAPSDGGAIQYFDDGGLIYRMCGLGAECSIAAGKASTKRGLLLQREGLELALYSFHYLDVKSVVVLMPPPPGESPDKALFLREGDVAAQLARPLAATLMQDAPSTATITRARDAPLVAALTTPNIFTFSLTRANTQRRGILVLDPPTAAPAASGSGSSSG